MTRVKIIITAGRTVSRPRGSKRPLSPKLQASYVRVHNSSPYDPISSNVQITYVLVRKVGIFQFLMHELFGIQLLLEKDAFSREE